MKMKRQTLSWGVAAGLMIGLWNVNCATQRIPTEPSEPTEPSAQMQAAFSPAAASPAQDPELIARGRGVFEATCSLCHTVNGLPSKSGPDLSDFGSEGWSHERVVDMLRDFQRYYPGSIMPTWDEAYSQQDLKGVAAYVLSLREQAFYLENWTQ